MVYNVDPDPYVYILKKDERDIKRYDNKIMHLIRFKERHYDIVTFDANSEQIVNKVVTDNIEPLAASNKFATVFQQHRNSDNEPPKKRRKFNN